MLGLLLCGRLMAADLSQLQQLEENDRIFELRRAVEQPGWNDAEIRFYRAAIEARFGHETAAVPELRQFLEDHPDPRIERWAYQELASALERLGRYGEAAEAWTGALRFTPANDYDRKDTENTRALNEALRDVAPQTVRLGGNATIEAKQDGIGSWNVPVEVNGREGEWIFDTGANVSTIIESEAKRMGLTIRKTGTYVRGSTRAKNDLRIAVAHDLRFGNAQFSNVVFLVLKDEALYLGPLKYQIRGILGLPVIRALDRIEVTAKGTVHVGAAAPVPSGDPDLFFDELSLEVEARHDNHPVQLFLDTGANETAVYPSFRSALSEYELHALKKKRESSAGAGGEITREAEVVPTLHLNVLGRTDEIAKVSLISKQPKGSAGLRDGVLGMDGLTSDFTLDFRSMQLTLQ